MSYPSKGVCRGLCFTLTALLTAVITKSRLGEIEPNVAIVTAILAVLISVAAIHGWSEG